MAKSREINMNLPSVDDLFTTQEERDQKNQEYVKDISIYEITDFPNHPFKVKMDDKMVETIESVREHGVLVPALVREKPTGGYEMISGHRRKMACEMAGRENIPCIVRNLTDDEAVIVMVDSNLQREEILPSEKAFAYKMRLEAMKRQAGRPSKENVSPVATHLRGKRSDELLGEQVGESKDTIRRYIRLTELIPEILEMVDDKKISMRPAVELSYLPKEEQAILYDTMESEACTPSHAQAIKIRKFSAEGRLNEDVLLLIMSEEKPNQVEQWKIPKNRLKKYFPSGTTQQKILEENELPAEKKISVGKYYRIQVSGNFKQTRKIRGLRGLYLHYCYLLGILPKNRPSISAKQVHVLFREDLLKLNTVSKETKLLCHYHIDTADQLFSLKDHLQKQMEQCAEERKHLRYKIRADRPEEEIEEMKEQIKVLTEKIGMLRKKTALCDGIAARSKVIEEKFKTVREEKEKKEEQSHEHIRRSR